MRKFGYFLMVLATLNEFISLLGSMYGGPADEFHVFLGSCLMAILGALLVIADRLNKLVELAERRQSLALANALARPLTTDSLPSDQKEGMPS